MKTLKAPEWEYINTCKPPDSVHEILTRGPTAFEKHAALVTLADSCFVFPHINNQWTRRSVSTQRYQRGRTQVFYFASFSPLFLFYSFPLIFYLSFFYFFLFFFILFGDHLPQDKSVLHSTAAHPRPRCVTLCCLR